MRFRSSIRQSLEKYITPEKGSLKKQGDQYLNCNLKNGRVVCRKGFCGDPYNPVFRSDFSPYTENELRITDCYIYMDGKYGRVAVAVADDLMDSIVFYPKLIFTDGSVTELGSITFGRVTPTLFGRPSNFTVFSGKAVKGCGIFMIVRQVYGSGIEDFIRIMELSDDKSIWIPISDSDLYLPTLLANGRGECYFGAMPRGEYLDLPDPIYPESKNLLLGRFKAYYTTESASPGFFLPLDNLDEQLISATFEEGGQTVRWKIYEGSEASEITVLDEQEIVMLCDRKIGRVYFKNPDGRDVPLPYTGKLNNLCIEASRAELTDTLKVASCSSAMRLESASGESHGGMNVLYGSYLNPNLAVISSPAHPLYFPESTCFALGEPSTRIEKMINRDHTLLAFKADRLFAAEIKPVSVKTAVAELSNGSALSAYRFSPTFRVVAELPAPALPKTVKKLSDRVIYATKTGEIFAITGRGTGVYKTEKVGECEVGHNSFAVMSDEGYVCFCDDKAVVISEEDGELSFVRWSLPVEIVGGFSHSGESVLFSQIADFGTNLIYPVLQKGDIDRFVTISAEGLAENTKKIEAQHSFSPFEKSCHPVKLTGLRIEGRGDRLVVIIDSEDGMRDEKRTQIRGGKARIVLGKRELQPRITVKFSDGELCGASVEYRRLNKL